MQPPPVMGYAPEADDPPFKPDEPVPLFRDLELRLRSWMKGTAGSPTKTLIDGLMPPVRDQGSRNSCFAFAATACLEYHFARNGQYLDLSEEFLCWVARSAGASSLGRLFPRLPNTGSCLESTWPYDPVATPSGNVAQSIVAEAYGFRCDVVAPADSHSSIVAALDSHRPVGIGIPVFAEWWTNEEVWASGEIRDPENPSDMEPIDHAITLVGYSAPGRYFIFRNSFAGRWGVASPYGAGYGTIPFSYFQLARKSGWYIQS